MEALLGIIFGIFITIVASLSYKGIKLKYKNDIKHESDRVVYENKRLLAKEGIKLS